MNLFLVGKLAQASATDLKNKITVGAGMQDVMSEFSSWMTHTFEINQTVGWNGMLIPCSAAQAPVSVQCLHQPIDPGLLALLHTEKPSSFIYAGVVGENGPGSNMQST